MKCFQINFKKRVYILTVLLTVLMASCIDKYEKMQKYQRPDVLDGKLFDLISNQDSIEMEMFAQMLMDTGFDSLINKTGTYAVFAPNDNAMRLYLQGKYGTANLDEIPVESKDSIVRYHILQMPWNKDQLQSLSSKGWISPDDASNDEPSAFKRKTLFKSDNKVYNTRRAYDDDGDPYDEILMSGQGEERIVYNDVNKYVPLFFDDFLALSGLDAEDYAYYFDRPYEANNVYYANAKIMGDEQFAENGFLYEIDQVVDVMPNAEEILSSGDYSVFLQLIYNYASFKENEAATNNQDGVDEGIEVPTLYSLNYPSYVLDIHNELVVNSKNTVENNLGFVVPDNSAMERFLETYFSGKSWEQLSPSLKSLILANHLGQKALYKSDLEDGFLNALGDVVSYDLDNIKEKVYGSNCTFVGGDEVLVPLAFSKVSAPLLLDPNYSVFFEAMTREDLISVLKKESAHYSFFMKDDDSFLNDSSLVVLEFYGRNYLYTYDDDRRLERMGTEFDLRRKLYGHI